MAFIGNTATTQAFTPAIDYFSGNASTTAFTLSRPVASVAQVQAVIENVPQNPGSAFTVSGNTITFTSAPPTGTNNIYVYYTSPITQVVQPGQGTVGTAQLNTASLLIPLANGGTGATTASSARSALSAAASGANSDITSLSGLTTPLSVGQGGTGAATSAGAPFALKGANSDITSLSGLTTPLSVAQGGTGLGTTPANGQLNIGNGTGFTRATLTAGSGISVTNGAGSITIAATGGGTVTSVATGNGLQGGTITTSGTLSIAAPTLASVGSYVFASLNTAISVAPGSTQPGSNLSYSAGTGITNGTIGSGTWRCHGYANGAACGGGAASVWCRIS